MSGIYGNNNEDKYFENKLLNHLEGFEYVINTNIEFDDYQFKFENQEYSVSGIVDIVDSNIVNIEYFEISAWSESELDWISITENAKHKVFEYLDNSENFMNYLYDKGEL